MAQQTNGSPIPSIPPTRHSHSPSKRLPSDPPPVHSDDPSDCLNFPDSIPTNRDSDGRLEVSSDSATLNLPSLLPFLPNDYGNALRILSHHGCNLAYIADSHVWMVWDGHRWTFDYSSILTRRLATQTIHRYHEESLDRQSSDTTQSHALSSLSAGSIRAALEVAQPLASQLSLSDLDTHPDLLNFSNVTLDLRTGTSPPHRQSDYLTKTLRSPYVSDAAYPEWALFLDTILSSDEEMLEYLQVSLGYTLTGHTSAKAVFIPYGRGDNGKTTLLSVLRSILGEYATIIQIDSLVSQTQSGNTSADIADLRGVRFAQTSEADEHSHLSVGTIKRITQGQGTIKSAKKYQNPIEFPETHKLWLDTNHLPKIDHANDLALFSRLHPIHFRVRIPKEDQDSRLSSKLKSESAGILAWLVDGARMWYSSNRRLPRPAALDREVKSWKQQSDWMERFLSDRCVVARTKDLAKSWSSEADYLYRIYTEWADEGNDDQSRSRREFGTKIRSHIGITFRKLSKSNRYFGVKVKASGRMGAAREEQTEQEDETED